MKTIEAALLRAADAAKFFVKADELRVLHVLTSTPLRVAVLDSISVVEHVDANDRIFLTLEIPPDGELGGFDRIAEELRADLTDLRDTFLEENPASTLLAPLPPPVTHETGVARLGAELFGALRTIAPPLRGLTLILAPVSVDDPRTYADAVAALVARPELANVKFVVVDSDADRCGAALRRFGPAVETVDARFDEAGAAADAQAMLHAMKAAPPDASPRAKAGLAAPRVAPPARRKLAQAAPKEAVASNLASVGVPTALADVDAMQQIRVLVLDAAASMRNGRAQEAIATQRRAAEVAERIGLAEQALTLELMAGGYALQAGASRAAIDHFTRVLRRATDEQAQTKVQAQLYIGSALVVERRVNEAVVAYAEAGALAIRSSLPVFAIEGYRMAGQLLIEQGRLEEAAAAMNRAIGIGTSLPPEEAPGTSAAHAARALAKLCKQHGLTTQAQSLLETAKRLETPPPATEPTGEGSV